MKKFYGDNKQLQYQFFAHFYTYLLYILDILDILANTYKYIIDTVFEFFNF